MSLRKRFAFALFTFVLFFALVEGVARVIWSRMEGEMLAAVAQGGEAVLRNDSIHFLKEADPVYGYVLRPGYQEGQMHVNDQGFFQREPVAQERAPGVLRVIALGESTTMGHGVDDANYPFHLRRLLAKSADGYAGTEVVNAGVAGWISDQVALRAEHELARFEPDVVVLYVGWNDFQSYNPYGAPPIESYFDTTYGYTELSPFARLRSVALLTAFRDRKLHEERTISPPPAPAPGEHAAPRDTYRYFLLSLDRIVTAFRSENPDVVIAIATLVARWPQGTRAEFDAPNGHVWWMEHLGLGPEQGAEALARFNGLIRAYAAEHGLLLVDLEAQYAGLDRGRLFWDFAHMHPEGYELMASAIYDALRSEGAVRGRPDSRRAALEQRHGLVVR